MATNERVSVSQVEKSEWTSGPGWVVRQEIACPTSGASVVVEARVYPLGRSSCQVAFLGVPGWPKGDGPTQGVAFGHPTDLSERTSRALEELREEVRAWVGVAPMTWDEARRAVLEWTRRQPPEVGLDVEDVVVVHVDGGLVQHVHTVRGSRVKYRVADHDDDREERVSVSEGTTDGTACDYCEVEEASACP